MFQYYHLKRSHRETYPFSWFDIIGIRFFDAPDKFFIKTKVRFIAFVLSFYFLCSVVTYECFKYDEASIRGLASIIPSGILGVIGVAKQNIVFRPKNRQRVAKLIKEIDELWPSEDQLVEYGKKKILDDWIKKSAIFFRCIFCAALAHAVFSTFIMSPSVLYYKRYVNPNVEIQEPIPMSVIRFECPKALFIVYILYQAVISVAFEVICYFSLNIVIGLKIMNIKALFIILQVDLENIIKEEKLNQIVSNTDHCYDELKKIVQRHQKILSICDNLNELYSFTTFLDVTCAATVMAFYGFAVATEVNVVNRVLHALRMASVSLTVLLLTWPAEVLAGANDGVAEAAYSCLWYLGNARIKSLVLLVMQRAMIPVYLKAFIFSNVVLETYSKLCSTAFSYVSVLSQVHEK
uniref:Odorant receptor n=1 Tax=Leucinodes orbonalis TaxID=711050 RepID=A0AAU0QLQ8_9NEOP|nr:odorant receptor [Leucinodes orbonalis]